MPQLMSDDSRKPARPPNDTPVLRALAGHDDPIPIQKILDETQCTQAEVEAEIKALNARGLVVGRPDEHRVMRYAITRAGRRVVAP